MHRVFFIIAILLSFPLSSMNKMPEIIINNKLNTKGLINFLLKENKLKPKKSYNFIKQLIRETADIQNIPTESVEKIINTIYFNLGFFGHKHYKEKSFMGNKMFSEGAGILGCKHENNNGLYSCSIKKGIKLINEERKKDEAHINDLHLAILYNNLDFFKTLFDKADYDVRQESADELLHASIIVGNIECIKMLITENKNSLNYRSGSTKDSLWHLITTLDASKALTILKILTEYYEEKHKKLLNIMEFINDLGDTPIHTVCSHYCRDVGTATLQFILEKYPKIDINLKNDNGDTPLNLACLWDCYKTIRILMKKGADPSISNKFGDVPLHRACMYKNLKSAKALLKKNAQFINARNKNKQTPLLLLLSTLRMGSQDYTNILTLILFLLEKGADPSLQDKNGDTALHILFNIVPKDDNEIDFIGKIVGILLRPDDKESNEKLLTIKNNKGLDPFSVFKNIKKASKKTIKLISKN